MPHRGGSSRQYAPQDHVVLEEAHLDRVLSGELPCAVCGYELRGLSIRGRCPECGTPVRATILFRVDPRAKEFRPLIAPKLTANAMMLWSLGGLAAALGFWLTHLLAYMRAEMGIAVSTDIARNVTLIAITASWLGALGLIHPIRGGAIRKTAAASGALLAYALLLLATIRLHEHDRTSLIPYIDTSPDAARVTLRAISGAAAIAIILGLRPNVRELVDRCLVLRTGRVARQTLLALALALALGIAGDALHALSLAFQDATEPSVLSNAGTLLIAISGAFILAGLVHAQFDTWHIRKSILAPSPTLEDLISDEKDTAESDPPAPSPPGRGPG